MKRVITYGTYDLLHHGHIRLLERAKALGDYLVVGVTSDDYDKSRGKINVRQSLSERIEAVRSTGIADEIIVEEYEGQKIDDIRRMDIDVFTVGSDWVGVFDYLNEFCEVVYLDRTKGISSTDIRERRQAFSIGLVGNSAYLNKVASESLYVNGIQISGVCCNHTANFSKQVLGLPLVTKFYDELLDASDAVFIHSTPGKHYDQVKKAILRGKHVLCESPVAMTACECQELYRLAKDQNVVLIEALRTAYATAFNRLVLLVKGGRIGDVVSVDAVCTSLKDLNGSDKDILHRHWNSITGWAPTALLPIFQILGTGYRDFHITSRFIDEAERFDTYTRVTFEYSGAMASLRVGNGAKSEGELVVSGTKGYIYVPAPWWKTDYFEVRFEDQTENRKYFYQLEGEGLRYELADFAQSVGKGKGSFYINEEMSVAIARIMEAFENRQNLTVI